METLDPEITHLNGGKFTGLEELTKITRLQGRIPHYRGAKTLEELRGIIEGLDTNKLYAVRSSGLYEDSDKASLAGHFSTHLNVATHEIPDRYDQIQNHAKQKGESNGIPVIIQEMVCNPELSGVAFSRSIENPHYVTISLIPGLGENLVNGSTSTREIRIHRLAPAPESLTQKYPFLIELIACIKDIDDHFNKGMDIEFAIKDGELKFLQARPLVSLSGENDDSEDKKETLLTLNGVRNQVVDILKNDDTMLGNMIDINPRELQGELPTDLSVSLFSELFPAGPIRHGRDSLGYSCSRNNCLHRVGGRTYINLHTAAQNFRPCGISDEQYDKICAHYLDEMKQHHQANSSAEFGLFFITDDAYGREGLKKVFGEESDNILSQYSRLRKALDFHSQRMATGDFQEILEKLNKERDKLLGRLASKPGNVSDTRERMADILKLLKEYTEFFVIVARLDFYQNYQFRSLTKKYKISDSVQLLSGNETFYIRRLRAQIHILQNQKNQKLIEDYLREYGHMRYHQFDLHVSPDRDIFKEQLEGLDPNHLNGLLFSFGRHRDYYKSRLAELLQIDPTGNVVQCLTFTRYLDAAREQTKFEFMKLYDALTGELRHFARLTGIALNDLSFLNIEELQDATDIMILKNVIETRKKLRASMSHIQMPDHIFHPDDVFGFELPEHTPIFLGRKGIEKRSIVEVGVREITTLKRSFVEGKIVLLEDSDQGAVSILGFNPAGIITRTGSGHSHLSISLRESDIPSILNIGETEYRKFQQASRASIDVLKKSYQLNP